MNRSVIFILNTKGTDYRCIIGEISKSQAVNLLQKIDFLKNWNIAKYKNLFSHIKWVKKF